MWSTLNCQLPSLPVLYGGLACSEVLKVNIRMVGAGIGRNLGAPTEVRTATGG